MQAEPIITGPGSARALRLDHAVVADVMHPGVVSCPPETDLVTVARMMASHHIHAVVVSGEQLEWGLISDLDLVAAALPAVPPDGRRATTRAPRSSWSIATSRSSERHS